MARRVPVGAWTDETEEDEWVERGWHRHVAAPARGTDLLAPDRYYSGSQRRSRSTGARPVPNVTVYQTTKNEYDHSPPRSRSRRRSRYDDEDVVDALEDIRHELKRDRSRDRTPAVLQPHYRDSSPYYREMQMELARENERNRWELERERKRLEVELDRDRIEARERSDLEAQLVRTRAEIRRLKEKREEDERDARRHTDEEKWKRELELEKLKDDTQRKADELRRKEERDRILSQHDREERDEKEKRRRDRLEWERKEAEEEEERKRVVNEYRLKEERKQREEKEKEEAAIAHFKKKQEEEKKKKADLIAQYKREEEEQKEKEKREKEMWKLKLEQEKRADEEKKKKQEEEVKEEMRRKLAKVGFQDNQVEAILDPKKAEKVRPGTLPSNALVLGNRNPTFVRVKRTHIDVETLRYYGLPWEYDSGDPEYIIILQEMEQHETELLFEHTRKLRKGATTLLIEERGRHKQPQYAFVRRRPSASPNGRRRSSPKRAIQLW